MFDAIKYFRDRRIETSTTGAKSSHGWVNTYCPVCRSQDKHLGFNLEGGYFHCWHGCRVSTEALIMLWEGIEYHEACRIASEYEDDFIYRPPPGQKAQAQGLNGTIEWPRGTVKLQDYHKAYLNNRRYDPDFLEKKYELKGTIGAGAYAYRIMAPIFFQERWVSYQGRDITNKAMLKYKACKKTKELIDHTTILYNLDNCRGGSVIVVEGLPDVWRLGDNSCGTFGTSILLPQIRLLSKFKRVFVLFDSEYKAQLKARQVCNQLAIFRVETIQVSLDKGDPGDMEQDDANHMKKELLK